MFKLARKSIGAHKGRVFTTALAVILGIAFVAGTLVLSSTIQKVFDDLFADVNEGTDAVVRVHSDIEGFGEAFRGRVDESVLSHVLSADGVAFAEGDIQSPNVQLIDKDGEKIGNSGFGAPTLGFNWSEDEDLNAFTIADGEPPVGPDQVVIDRKTADDNDFAVGDTIQIQTNGSERHDFTLVGIATFGAADSPAGANVALFDTATAQQLLAEPGKFDAISVVADPGVSEREVARNIREAIADSPQDLEVLTGAQITAENQNDIKEGLGFFTIALSVFAFIALGVGSFVIYNTFGIIVAQRGREMALLRAIGASRRQVLGSILLESILIGLFGSIVGLVLGIFLASGLKAALDALGFDLPASGTVVTGSTVVTCLVLGTLVTVLAAVFPARRASKVPPVAAMRDLALDTSGSSRVRLLIGTLITALGVLFLGLGLFANGGASKVGLGAAAVFVGMTVLGPVIAPVATRVLGWPLPKIKGMTGQLAKENALRNPKRTASTAAALMIGVGLVGFITIFADSTKASISDVFNQGVHADFIVNSGSFGEGGFSPDLERDIDALPEVKATTPFRFGFAKIHDEDSPLFGMNTGEGFDILDVGVVAGDPADLDEDGIAVLDDEAADQGLTIGDTVQVEFSETGRQEMTVGLIFSNEQLTAPARYFLGLPAYEANFAEQLDVQIFVQKADDVSLEDAQAAITRTAHPYANAEVQNIQEFIDSQSEIIDQLLSLIYVLLMLAIVIAVFGIANTLALSIIERHRELGLLRAVGMTRRQLRSAVRWEAVLIAILGTVLGLIIGLFFSWVLVKALNDQGITVLRVPVGQLAIIVVVAAVFGVVAAILPARRASKLNILDAVFSE